MVYWQRKYRGKQVKEPLYLATNLSDISAVIEIYSQRFGIEAMFKDCKTGGYNLEGSSATPQRLERLILLIAIAMTLAWLQGNKIQFSRQESYFCRPCEHQRTRKRHSSFWIGLYGYNYNWITSFLGCQKLVLQMMDFVPHKKVFYQKGLRAMMLIQQSF